MLLLTFLQGRLLHCTSTGLIGCFITSPGVCGRVSCTDFRLAVTLICTEELVNIFVAQLQECSVVVRVILHRASATGSCYLFHYLQLP